MKKCTDFSIKTNRAVVNNVTLVYNMCNGFWATFTYGCFYLQAGAQVIQNSRNILCSVVVYTVSLW